MPKHRKDEALKGETLTIRLRRDQKRDLIRAAQVESGRRTGKIEAGPLAVELFMPGVYRILEAPRAGKAAA